MSHSYLCNSLALYSYTKLHNYLHKKLDNCSFTSTAMGGDTDGIATLSDTKKHVSYFFYKKTCIFVKNEDAYTFGTHNYFI